MCVAISLPLSELPVELVEQAGLSARVHDRGGEKEVRFYWRAVPALLAVWWGGGQATEPPDAAPKAVFRPDGVPGTDAFAGSGW
jgi:hypothetical protein